MNRKILKAITIPNYVINAIYHRVAPFIKDDETAVKISYILAMHKRLNLGNPRSFNEKLQWLKLHDKHPEYTQMVDKIEAKKIAAKIIGEEHIIPTLGVWDKFEDIDFDKLPNQFVLKCNHDSGGVVICKDKTQLDIEAARKKINKCLHRNPFWATREYPYKNVKPRILAEKFMVDESGVELKDYKFYCFNGEPVIFFIAAGRNTNLTYDFYDLDFNHLPFHQGRPWAETSLQKPKNLDRMIDFARKLSKGITQVRMDFYDINGDIYFGEYTFFDGSGCIPFEPVEWDYKLGDLLILPHPFTKQ